MSISHSMIRVAYAVAEVGDNLRHALSLLQERNRARPRNC